MKKRNRQAEDPSFNVRETLDTAIKNQDALREIEVKRIDQVRAIDVGQLEDKFRDSDIKYQIQFSAAEKALGIALTAAEKQTAAALEGTKEAITKNDTNTETRFTLLSEKIDTLAASMSKKSGEAGIYVTHSDLSTEMEKLRTSFETMLRPVITFMNSQQGGSEKSNSIWGYVVGAAGIASTVIILALKFLGK